MKKIVRTSGCLAVAATVSLCGSPTFAADIVTRTPNMGSVTLPEPGTADFEFNHRLAGLSSLSAVPTFTVDLGVLPWLSIYGVYASKAAGVAPLGMGPVRGSHDVGIGLRQSIMQQADGAPFSLSLSEGMAAAGLKGGDPAATWSSAFLTSNSPQQGLGAMVGRTFGPLGLVGAVRAVGYQYTVIANTLYPTAGVRTSATLGATLKLTDYLSLAGDYGKYVDALGDVPAWSAAIQGQIPMTPHLGAVEGTNVPTTTRGGASQAGAFGDYYVGFAFSVGFKGASRWQKMFTPDFLKPPAKEEAAEETMVTSEPEPAAPAESAPVQPAPVAPAPGQAAAPAPAATGDTPVAAATPAPAPTKPAAPAIDPALIAKGKKLYADGAADMGCAMCHGDNAKGGDGGPSVVGASVATMKKAFKGDAMEPFRTLKDADLKALEAYLKSLKK